jgi:ligand-binding sensor domain-containing protein
MVDAIIKIIIGSIITAAVGSLIVLYVEAITANLILFVVDEIRKGRAKHGAARMGSLD